MAGQDDINERVAVLETQHKSTQREIGGIQAGGLAMRKELQHVQKDLTRLLTTATNMKYLIGLAIPLSPALGVLFAKVIGL